MPVPVPTTSKSHLDRSHRQVALVKGSNNLTKKKKEILIIQTSRASPVSINPEQRTSKIFRKKTNQEKLLYSTCIQSNIHVPELSKKRMVDSLKSQAS